MSGISGNRTGEIAHTRDAANALTSSYGGSRPARAIANEQAASMVGQKYLGGRGVIANGRRVEAVGRRNDGPV